MTKLNQINPDDTPTSTIAQQDYPLQYDESNSLFKLLAAKLKMEHPKTDIRSIDIKDAIKEFSEKNNLKCREIKLENDWWKYDQGILIGFDTSNQPFVLIPNKLYGYKKIDPTTGEIENITKSSINELANTAYMFYTCFPRDKISLKHIFLASLKMNKGNIISLLSFHFILGILALLLPLISGHLFDYIIPFADTYGLAQLSLVLIANVIFSSLINLNYFIAASRVKLLANYVVQSAVWDRLINLPLSFFMLINSGDVANRASSIDTIQESMTSTTISSTLTGIFSLFSFCIMIYLSAKLSLILFLIVFILAATNIAVAFYQYQKLKDIYTIEGKLYGYLNQLFQNISKIKVFNSQKPFFYNWLNPFLGVCKTKYNVEKIQINLSVFRFSVMILGTIIVYFYAYKFKPFDSFGDFIIYNSLYTYFMTSFLGLSSSFITIISILPLFDRIKPILNTKVEDLTNGVILKEPRGKIELNNIYVRYENSSKYNLVDSSVINTSDEEQYISPWILQNINLSINENDFVAIVGLSGGGKTTLIKLILGLLQPHKGTLSIDNYDMQVIDKYHYRKNIGAILQSSTLFSGSILENIADGRNVDITKITELATNLGVDEFINSLPMKYDTILAEGGRNISMGQKQKLLIMKALIREPKIILFDEATSALDNESQRKIFDYLKQLLATRIIVSHRLTTVKEAQKIILLDKGSIVAEGTYDEIITSAVFKKLMNK